MDVVSLMSTFVVIAAFLILILWRPAQLLVHKKSKFDVNMYTKNSIHESL